MLEEKKAVSRALNNAEGKANNLNTDDLVEDLTMRAAAHKAKAEASTASAEETSAQTLE